MLVAPVKIGENATIGAGSTITEIAPAERLTLARRASGRVAAALLRDVNPASGKTKTQAKDAGDESSSRRLKSFHAETPELRVMKTALENPRLTEALLIHAVLQPGATVALVHAVAWHEKWALRKEIRAALLRTLRLRRQATFSKIILFFRIKIISTTHPVPPSPRGAYRDRHERWVRDAVDAWVLRDGLRHGGRSSRVVLTPRRWRQVLEKQASWGRR